MADNNNTSKRHPNGWGDSYRQAFSRSQTYSEPTTLLSTPPPAMTTYQTPVSTPETADAWGALEKEYSNLLFQQSGVPPGFHPLPGVMQQQQQPSAPPLEPEPHQQQPQAPVPQRPATPYPSDTVRSKSPLLAPDEIDNKLSFQAADATSETKKPVDEETKLPKATSSEQPPAAVEEGPRSSITIATFAVVFHKFFYILEWLLYGFVEYTDRFLENNKLLESWRKPVEKSNYYYLRRVRTHPLWYCNIRHYSFYIGWYCVCAYLLYTIWLPTGLYIKGQLVTADMKVLYMTKPIDATNVVDFVSDFADSASMSEKRVEELRSFMNARADAVTQAELDVLNHYNLEDNNGDGIPDIMQTDSRDVVNYAFKKGVGLRGLQDLLDSTSYWGGSGDADSNPITQLKSVVPPLAEEIFPSEQLVSRYYAQYMQTTHSIVIKSGNHDLVKYYLDSEYNPLYQCLLNNNKQRQLEAERISREAAGAIRTAENECLRKRDENDELARRGRSEMPCVCNAHYGQTNLWAYTTMPGHESLFFSNYRIIPMNYTDFIKANGGVQPNAHNENYETAGSDPSSSAWQYHKNVHNLMRSRGIEESDNTSLGATDNEFWRVFGRNGQVEQPIGGFLIEADVLPDENIMRDYYGETYGPTSEAIVNGIALIRKERQDATSQRMGLTGYINRGGHFFNYWNEDLTSLDELGIRIGQERARMASTRRRLAQESSANGNSSRIEILTKSLYNMAGFHYETTGMRERNRILNAEPPKLVRKRFMVPDPFSRCAVKCYYMQNLLLAGRQAYYEKTNNLRPVDPDRYKIKLTDFVNVIQ